MSVPFKTNIGTQYGNEHKLKKDKKSVFSLTINPNISSIIGTSFHDDLHDKLMRITKELFGNIENFAKIIKFRDPTHSFNDKYIKSVDLTPTVEYGRLKKLHLNASIVIEHHSNIQLNREKLIKLYADACNVEEKAIHIDIRVAGISARSDEERLKNYVLQNRAVDN